MTDLPISIQSKTVKLPTDVVLSSGVLLSGVEVGYTIYSDRDSPSDRFALIFHGLSSDAHLHQWWPKFQLDQLLKKYSIISIDCLGSSYRTTGPHSLNTITGRPYLGDFPVISIADTNTVNLAALRAIGIEKLDFVLGCSLGGMQALDLFLTLCHDAFQVFLGAVVRDGEF